MTSAAGVPAGPLRFGLSLMNFDDFAEARRVADLARVAEDAGWEALLVWDHLAFAWGTPSGDPWTLVTAAALATERLLVGTDVSVIARERPLPFARPPHDDRPAVRRARRPRGRDRRRARRVPQGGRARGPARARGADRRDAGRGPGAAGRRDRHPPRAVAGRGRRHAGARCRSRRGSRSGSAGGSRGARRRAARHDGWIPVTVDDEGRPCLTPDDVRAALVEIRAERARPGSRRMRRSSSASTARRLVRARTGPRSCAPGPRPARPGGWRCSTAGAAPPRTCSRRVAAGPPRG